MNKSFLPLLSRLFFILQLVSLNVMAMNDTNINMKAIFTNIKSHPKLSDVILDGMATSFPIPILVDDDNSSILHFSVFNFYRKLIKTTDPKEARLSAPFQKLIISYPTLEVIKVESVKSVDFGVNWDDTKPIGKIISDPKFLGEAGFKRADRYFELYDIVLPLFITKTSNLDEKTKKELGEFKTLFAEVGQEPLLPYYRGLNPDFFKWLDDNLK